MNNNTAFIISAGLIVLGIFIFVAVYNLLPGYKQSNSYYVKVGDDMSAKIEALDIQENALTIKTSGDATEYCVKSTKSTPKPDSICWKMLQNNSASISVYKDKRYYIWIKDINGNISIPMSISTNDSNE